MSKKERYYVLLVLVWALVSLWAAITHLLFPFIISNTWNWGLDKGMQREIAIWNIGFLVITACALKAWVKISQIILPGILTLSTLFALNHALSYNWGGVLLNMPPLILALGITLFV